MEKRRLSKSQIQLWLQCPYKWKLIYIDKLESIQSPQQERGIDIHKQIEEFYKNISVMETTIPTICIKKGFKINENFLKFEQKRIKSCMKNGVFDEKYFKPLYQELKVENDNIQLRGIIDAVYLNPKDDKIIIIDWKSGKFRNYAKNDYRFELAIYKEIFEREYNKEVGYWGMYFVDEDKLFFEKVEYKHIARMFRIVNKVREEMSKEIYTPKQNYYCQYCQFQDKCQNDGNK